MTDKIGRNAPCPCGSGKKYKACCRRKSQPGQAKQRLSPQFRFEPGSYGDAGHFMPSIACLKQIAPDDWAYHFVLVKPTEQHVEEDDATDEAEEDLRNAFVRKERTGSDVAVAEYLRAQGYVSVTGFKIVQGGNETGWRNVN